MGGRELKGRAPGRTAMSRSRGQGSPGSPQRRDGIKNLKTHLIKPGIRANCPFVNAATNIERAISKLDRQSFAQLEVWFDEYRNRRWDRQIEEDSCTGALEFLLREVDVDIAEGRVRPADELWLGKPILRGRSCARRVSGGVFRAEMRDTLSGSPSLTTDH